MTSVTVEFSANDALRLGLHVDDIHGVNDILDAVMDIETKYESEIEFYLSEIEDLYDQVSTVNDEVSLLSGEIESYGKAIESLLDTIHELTETLETLKPEEKYRLRLFKESLYPGKYSGIEAADIGESLLGHTYDLTTLLLF